MLRANRDSPASARFSPGTWSACPGWGPERAIGVLYPTAHSTVQTIACSDFGRHARWTTGNRRNLARPRCHDSCLHEYRTTVVWLDLRMMTPLFARTRLRDSKTRNRHARQPQPAKTVSALPDVIVASGQACGKNCVFRYPAAAHPLKTLDRPSGSQKFRKKLPPRFLPLKPGLTANATHFAEPLSPIVRQTRKTVGTTVLRWPN